MYLDGADWEADYFLAAKEYSRWKGKTRALRNMLRNCAQSAGFISGDDAPGAMTGTIPGCDRTFLLENEQCTDPYYARNLEHTCYAEKYSWAFRKRFTVPDSWRGKRVELTFKGLDYSCRIFINGEWLGLHEGMFIPESYDVTRSLRFEGDNLVAVVFDPAPQGSPDHRDDQPADFARFHRTQIGFGWDWARGFVPTGIYDSVILTAYDRVLVTEKQILFDGIQAQLKVEIEATSDMPATLGCCLSPENFEGKSASFRVDLNLKHGANSFTLSCPLPDDLRLWFPLGYGEQALYTLKMTIDGTTETMRTGFRTVSMSRNPGSPRGAADLTFNINGRKVFVRGVNYVPADLMLSRVTDKDYEHLTALAAAAGINYFRIWGGGVLEKEAFFEACDRYGIMVHQEFFHACSQAPKNAEFIAFKKREARAIIRRLYNHPCLTLLCGGNEVQYYGEIPDSPITENYRIIASEMVPQIPFRTGSPDLSRPGERHHGPWNWQEHKFWNHHFRCFASEVGCNGMPVFSSLKRFIPESEIKVMRGPALEYHFCHLNEGAHDLRRPLAVFHCRDMEEFCMASMFAQADTTQCVFEHYRRLWPESSGCVFWQYNEPWPTCAFSLVDYYGVPKQALYAMKRANRSILSSLKDDSWCCPENRLQAEWYITTEAKFSGKLSLRAVDCVSGKELFSRETEGTFPERTTSLAKIDEPLPPGITAVFLYIDGVCVNERLYGVPDFKTAFSLPKTSLVLRQRGNQITVTNTGNSVAVHVCLDFPGLPDKSVIFSDNFFSLPPGEERVVTFSGSGAGHEAVGSAWNLEKNFDPETEPFLNKNHRSKR